MVIGYDDAFSQYFIDRSASGKTTFHQGFAARHVAPRLGNATSADVDLVLDGASAELFADGGLTTMTSIFFPTKPYDKIVVNSSSALSVEAENMQSIWPR